MKPILFYYGAVAASAAKARLAWDCKQPLRVFSIFSPQRMSRGYQKG
jgi:hypothetical protein